MKRFLDVNFTVPGYHYWDQGVNPKYPQLALEHKHIFHINIVFQIPDNNDRPIEFIDFAESIKSFINSDFIKLYHGGGYDFKDMSCGDIAIDFAETIKRYIDIDFEKLYLGGGYNFKGRSCGDIAKEILDIAFYSYTMREKFPLLKDLKGTTVRISVKEDGMHGEIIESIL